MHRIPDPQLLSRNIKPIRQPILSEPVWDYTRHAYNSTANLAEARMMSVQSKNPSTVNGHASLYRAERKFFNASVLLKRIYVQPSGRSSALAVFRIG